MITRPIHFYHLVELYQRRNSVVAGKYFQLGYDLDPNTEGLEVYDYDDLGNVKMNGTTPMTTTVLNMAYYSNEYALLPVGTSAMPFDGHFEGNRLSIENINIRAAETISVTEHFATSDIGIFGYVNGDANIYNTYFNNVKIDLTGCDASQTIAGHNASHHENGVVYVGYLAGHVKESISIRNVFLNNCSIVGAESVAEGTTVAKNLYGYIGCVEHNNGTLVETLGDSIATQFGGGGTDPGWGNSLNMKTLHGRLYQIADAHKSDGTVYYPSVETLVVKVADSIDPANPPANFEYTKVISRDVTEMSNTLVNTSGKSLKYVHHGNDIAGSYYFNTVNGYNQYILLTGRNEHQLKTVNIYIAKDEDGTLAYLISDNQSRNYLSASTSKTIVNTTLSGATHWMMDSDNHLFTYIGVNEYYLNASGRSLTLSNVKVSSARWTIEEKEESAEIYTIQDGERYYLDFDGVWQLTSETSNFAISDGQGHYMGLDGTELIAVDSIGASASWEREISDRGTKFITYVGGIPMYLAFVKGQGLMLSPTTFSWTQDGSTEPYSYTIESGGKTWYLAYDDGWKVVRIYGQNIICEVDDIEHYLSADNYLEGVVSGTADSYKSIWDMDTSASSTAINLLYDGIEYSLDADVSTGEVYLRIPTDSEPATQWRKDSRGSYYLQINSIPFYLTYDGGWSVKTSSSLFIRNGSNYLAFDSSRPYNVGNVTSQSAGNNRWVFENPGGTGLVSINVEGITYYLNVRIIDGQKVLTLDYEHAAGTEGDVTEDPGWSVTDAVRWTGDNIGYYVTYEGEDYYLRYESGWGVSPVDYTFKASIDSNNYLAHQKVNGVYSVYSYTGSDTSNANVKWKSNGEYIWFVDNGTKHYLAFGSAGGTAVINDTPCRWWTTYETDDGVKNILNTIYDDVHYRLDCEAGNWVTTSLDVETVLFVDSTETTKRYLCVNQYSTGSRVTRTTDASNPKAHWVYDSAGNIYQDYGGNRYYLKFNTTGTNYKYLTVDTSGGSKWYDDTDFPGGVYTLYNDGKFVIYDDSSNIRGVNAKWNDIYCGDNYLIYSNGSIGTGTSTSEDREWFFEISPDTRIFTIHGGAKYYLKWDGSKISLTTSASGSGISWNVDSTGIYSNLDNQPLTYTTEWTCTRYLTKWVITDGTNYLTYDGTNLGETTSEADATAWTFSNTSALETETWEGTVQYGGKYLRNDSGSLRMSSTSTTWDVKNGAMHAKSSNYWIQYSNNKFKLMNPINDAGVYFGYYSSNRWNYLTSSLKSSTEVGDAAIFKGTQLSQSTDSKYYCLYGYLTYTGSTRNNYLQISYRDSTQDAAFFIGSQPSYQWEVGDSSKGLQMQGIKKQGKKTKETTYYLQYLNSKWTYTEKNSSRSDVRFFISNGAYPAKKSTQTPVTPAGYKDSYKEGSYEATDNRVLKENYWFGTETIVDHQPTSGFAETVLPSLELDPVFTRSKIISPSPTVVVTGKEISPNTKVTRTTAQRLYGPYTRTQQYSGYDSYIPLRLKLQDEEDETSFYSDYRIDSRNTGYIVSGSYQNISQNYQSDIRVSYYGTRKINKAMNESSTYSDPQFTAVHDSRLSVITKTAYSSGDNTAGAGGTSKVFGDNGYVRIIDEHNKLNINNYHSDLPDDAISYATMGLDKYETTESGTAQSRDAMTRILMDETKVYGLHFMESTISRNHIIYADYATILGKTYQNYELPEDCIDFKVKERGAINFFAGTYYTSDVDAFFSLHHIIRDTDQHITDIKEIKKIYQKGTKSYVYLYTDGTYSDGSSGPEAGAKMLFDTSWITDPTIVQNALYYFEIPVNSGEYALGSVPNKVGAYLIYLDIAINGGDVAESRISSEGSGVSNLFSIDYRDAGGTLDGTSLLQFEVNAPAENSSLDDKEYSVSMKYEEISDPKLKGLYTLDIINYTGEDLELTVFVCDNDDIQGNDYPYVYTVNYTNSTGTSTLIERAQTCDTYELPK